MKTTHRLSSVVSEVALLAFLAEFVGCGLPTPSHPVSRMAKEAPESVSGGARDQNLLWVPSSDSSGWGLDRLVSTDCIGVLSINRCREITRSFLGSLECGMNWATKTGDTVGVMSWYITHVYEEMSTQKDGEKKKSSDIAQIYTLLQSLSNLEDIEISIDPEVNRPDVQYGSFKLKQIRGYSPFDWKIAIKTTENGIRVYRLSQHERKGNIRTLDINPRYIEFAADHNERLSHPVVSSSSGGGSSSGSSNSSSNSGSSGSSGSSSSRSSNYSETQGTDPNSMDSQGTYQPGYNMSPISAGDLDMRVLSRSLVEEKYRKHDQHGGAEFTEYKGWTLYINWSVKNRSSQKILFAPANIRLKLGDLDVEPKERVSANSFHLPQNEVASITSSFEVTGYSREFAKAVYPKVVRTAEDGDMDLHYPGGKAVISLSLRLPDVSEQPVNR